MMIAVCLALLLVVPIRTAPANVAKECGSLVQEPGGRSAPSATEDRGWLAPVAQEQRLEAVCEDAASARWIYVGLVAVGLVVALWRALRGAVGLPSRVLLALVGIAVLGAAVFDGPPALLGLAVMGAGMAASRRLGSAP